MNDNNNPLVDYAPRVTCIAPRDDYGPYVACGEPALPNRGFCAKHVGGNDDLAPHTFANANNAWGECRICGEPLNTRIHANDGTALADILDALDRGARDDDRRPIAPPIVPEWLRRARESRDRFGFVAVHALA